MDRHELHEAVKHKIGPRMRSSKAKKLTPIMRSYLTDDPYMNSVVGIMFRALDDLQIGRDTLGPDHLINTFYATVEEIPTVLKVAMKKSSRLHVG